MSFMIKNTGTWDQMIRMDKFSIKSLYAQKKGMSETAL